MLKINHILKHDSSDTQMGITQTHIIVHNSHDAPIYGNLDSSMTVYLALAFHPNHRTPAMGSTDLSDLNIS